MGLYEEIFEQPEALNGLLDKQKENINEIARHLNRLKIEYVFLAARGTSDHAGLYAKYLFGIQNNLPVALAAPSMFSQYESPPQISNALVLTISQSGKSPDIVAVATEGRRQGLPTLAITNSPESPLAEASEFVINISAGVEKAVAATKTYSAELMAIAMLSAALNEKEEYINELHKVPDYISEVLSSDTLISNISSQYTFMNQCAIIGRGYNYATAFEWALKLKELTYCVAQPYSSADFRHGPIAIVDRGFPVLGVISNGAIMNDMMGLMRNLYTEKEANILIISNIPEVSNFSHNVFNFSPETKEWISPLVSIVPAQLFCYHLTKNKGLDPESPRGLQKITETT